MRIKIPKQLAEDLMLFGVVKEFLNVNNAGNFEAAKKLFLEFKKNIESAYKKLALEHHPDRGGDEEKMKEISAAMNRLKVLKIMPPRPNPIQITIIDNGFSSNTTFTSTGTSTTYYKVHRW